ncbi:hypothetical protein BT93_L0384 [Corymbia citriodora subsp. variegata]|uniref:Uncharacterized protein n=1 Tax=Corymbia citriodora subsp. variegata TaxID=360336 RepID=A0A8T0CGJ6_CORYI|nr:hypothetical protein BT93_L0384 [Corymbia citriodora subsp. variegata]
MFDHLPTFYAEDEKPRTQSKAPAQPQPQKVQKPTSILMPQAQRPAAAARVPSFFGLFPPRQISQTTSANTSPCASPLPSPGLQAPTKSPWFETASAAATRPPLKSRHTDMDVTCFPPAWS